MPATFLRIPARLLRGVTRVENGVNCWEPSTGATLKDDTGRVISSQAAQEWAEGSTTTAVFHVGKFVDTAFLIGSALGDGCLSRDKRWGTVTLHVQRCMRQAPYAAWQLEKLNEILGSRGTLKTLMDKGKYPAVRFGVSSKEMLGPVFDLLYPNGSKHFQPQVFKGLGVRELALFWMDDGSLEVRRRHRSRSVKIERSGWLAVSHDDEEADAIARWIYDITGSTGSRVYHRTGMIYLRWFSKQFKILADSISDYVHPCLAYKVDLSRTGTVAEWLSESQLPEWEADDKAARVPRTLAT